MNALSSLLSPVQFWSVCAARGGTASLELGGPGREPRTVAQGYVSPSEELTPQSLRLLRKEQCLLKGS